MDSNTEKYLEVFNKLENALKIKLEKNRFTPFGLLIKEGAKNDKFLKYHLSLLESLSDLRNVIVHKEGNKIIAVPSDYALNMLQTIYEKYNSPVMVEHICNNDVVTIRSDMKLYNALQIMKKHNYTKLPVYGKDGFKGMFTSATFTRWYLARLGNDENIEKALHHTVVSKLLTKDDVKFVNRSMNVYEFIDIIGKKYTKSGIYIVTEHGKRTERPIGIITRFDYKQIIDGISLNL